MNEQNTGEDLSGTENGAFSLDDLARIEAEELANQEEIRQKKEEARLEAERMANLKVQAVGDYATRTDFANELKSIEYEIEENHANEIQKRLGQVDQLRLDEDAKKTESTKNDAEFAAITENLNRVKHLVFEDGDESRPKDGVLGRTKEAFEIIKKEFNIITATRSEIMATITQISNTKDIADREIKAYHELVVKQQELTDKIKSLEENPALVEILIQEANTEKELRQDVKDALKREVRRETPQERIDFIGKITDQFLDEEFKARGIEGIKNHQDKLNAKKYVVDNMIDGFTINDASKLAFGEGIYGFHEKKDKIFAGKLLQNLVGNYGDSGATSRLMAQTILGESAAARPTDMFQKAIAESAKIHLNTLNLLRSTAIGQGETQTFNSLTVGFEGFYKLQRLDNDLRATGEFSVNKDNSAITPIDATKKQKAKINKDFQANLEQAQQIAKELKEKQEKARVERIGAIEKEIERLTVARERSQKLKQELNELGSSASYEKTAQDLENELNGIDESISGYENELNKVGWLERRRLNGEIVRLNKVKQESSNKLAVLKVKIEDIKKKEEEFWTSDDDTQIDLMIKRLQNELNGLKR